MRLKTTLLAAAILLLLAGPSALLAKDEGCLGCHADEDMGERARLPAVLFAGDAHQRAGLGCTDCHGGIGDETDLMKAHSKKRGFRGTVRAPDTPEVCGACHDDAGRMAELGYPDLPTGQAERFRKSVHGRIKPVEGFELPTCSSCHGPHGILAPSNPESSVHPTRMPETCNRCHGDLGYMRSFTSARVRVDQLLEYKTSVHGRRLAKGDEKVAVCNSCHGTHDILPADDPHSSVHPLRVAGTCGKCHANAEYMAGYTISGPGGVEVERALPTDQLERYERSVHHHALVEKGDLSAPTCNDCHGNHGATPPEVRTVATVCGQCHSRPAELFGASALEEDLAGKGFLGCSTCHGHHDIASPDEELLATLAAGNLRSGWKPDEAQRAVAAGFLQSIRELDGSISGAEEEVRRVENLGMDLTRANLLLNQARDQLVRARVTIHSFDPEQMSALVDGSEDEPGGLKLTAEATLLAEGAMGERGFRRKGLGVALAIIAVLIGALILKIRQIERPEAG